MSYDDLTDDELRELHGTARRFLAGEAEPEELPTESIKRVREAYKALRAVHAAMRAEMAQQMAAIQRATEDGGGAVSGPSWSGHGGGQVERAAGPSNYCAMPPG